MTGVQTCALPICYGEESVYGGGKSLRDGMGAYNTLTRATGPVLTDAITSADGYHQEATIRMPAGKATHSGNDVYLGAIGAGAGTFYGTIDNTRVFGLIKAAAGW